MSAKRTPSQGRPATPRTPTVTRPAAPRIPERTARGGKDRGGAPGGSQRSGVPWRSLAGLAAVVVVAGLLLFAARGAPTRHAIIVDQLSLTTPDPAFVAGATATLKQAGYAVDYVSGTDVTVRFLQNLPSRGDDLILLRVHSARILADGSKTDDVALFSGETMDPAHYEVFDIPAGPATAVAIAKAKSPAGGPTPVGGALSLDEQSRLIPVFYDPEDQAVPIFGVRPTFIEQDLKGRFKDASVVILMGCDGLRSLRLAEAFRGRGAGTFIGWDQPVSGPHVDAATARLLELMLRDRVPIPDAVARTMAEVGPDPNYMGRMVLAAP